MKFQKSVGDQNKKVPARQLQQNYNSNYYVENGFIQIFTIKKLFTQIKMVFYRPNGKF